MVSIKVFGVLALAQLALASVALLERDYSLPEELQLLKREGEDASYSCHEDCGYAILAAYQCSPYDNSTGPFEESCLCASNSTFNSLMPSCLECGWCLYTDYWPFLESAIAACSTIPVTPTGSTCSPTSSYSIYSLSEPSSDLLYVSSSAGIAAATNGTTTGKTSTTKSASSTSGADSSSASGSASASGSSTASSSASAGMGNTLGVSGAVGALALAILMV